ncbi:hypothetical protein [uncultured Roseobacter sp.]|uniref:hypothetical protein n=1 Tax=uncultured Roseobacter sp. TaxID=114847 RepID=UPI002618611A|nr:hypothetical protein [uncultured Roseobacter sp.]
MPRTIWTKLQSDPNGTWTQHQGEVPFSIPATGGLAYDVAADTGENFVITPTVEVSAPVITGVPVLTGIAQVGQTLGVTASPSTGTAPITTTWQWLRDGVEVAGATTDMFALGASDEGAAVSVRQTDTNAEGSDTATSAAQVVTSASGSAAVITGLLASEQSPAGTVELAYSIDQNSTVAGVLTRAATSPSAAQILAGQDHLGAPVASSFSDIWTTSGTETLPNITAGLAPETYYLHVLPAGGGDANVASSNGFLLETTAPQVTTAQTSGSGFEIELVFSEDLIGTTDVVDWTLTADGTTLAIATTSVTGSAVTLALTDVATTGQTLLLSYTGNGLADAVANPVAAFTALPVTNAITGNFVENSVTVPSGSYLTSAEPLPGTSRSLLFFSSLTQDAGLDARTALATWNGTNGGIHSNYSSGDGASGVRVRLQDGVASISQNVETITLGTRYHLLVSGWIDASNVMNVTSWVLDAATGNWAEVINTTDTSAPGTSLQLGPDPLRLFTRSDKTNHAFAGTVNRVALWSSTGSTPIADIADPAVRELFAGSTGMTDPAFSRSALGQPLVDFDGNAAAYNAGSHDGSLASFIPSGSFS